jgi:hypothetical protein
MLPLRAAAYYCGEPVSLFKSRCPARPVKLTALSRPKYDKTDLDKWIELTKSGGKEEESDDDIIAGL